MRANIKLVALIKSCLCIALLSMTFGATAAFADFIPLPPNVPPGTSVVLVHGHYAYHRGHRVYVPTHYVSYSSFCWTHRVWIPKHRYHGHMIRGHYRYFEYPCCYYNFNNCCYYHHFYKRHCCY